MIDHLTHRQAIVFLLLSLALITLPHVQHIPPALMVFFGMLLLWRLVGAWHPHWLPTRPLIFLVTLIGITLLITQQRAVLGRDAGTGILVVALGLKLLETRSRRDLYLVVFLAFLVAATQFLYEYSILMALYTLGITALLLATMAMQTNPNGNILAALRVAASLILQAMPLALAVFLLFPRIESPRWRWLEDTNQAKSGLSRTLEPGSISELSLSDERVFRVKFDGEAPPPAERYWRGPVYSYTDGEHWTALTNTDQGSPAPVFSGKAYRYTLLMEPQKENWVFALDIANDYDHDLRRNSVYQLTTAKNPGDRAEYHITSYTHYNTQQAGQNEYHDNLQLPAEPSDKLKNLVATLHGFDAPPAVFINNLLQHFHESDFYYTLNPPLLPDQPVERFLLETRSGYCSHYATAFVYLLRIAKIPARVVGGYQGGEFNRLGGFWEIRQADAHAWAEAWLDGKGWVRFDPTAAVAPERIERGVNVDLQIASGVVNFGAAVLDSHSLSWIKRGRLFWQSVDYNWQRWVINYHTTTQMQLLSQLGIHDVADIAQWMTICTGLITALLAALVLRRRAPKTDKALRLYQRFCNKLGKIDLAIRPEEGARAYAERVKQARPDLSESIETITRLFIRLRYEAASHRDDLPLLKQYVNRFRVRD